MPCNCGKSTKVAQNFVYTSPTGAKTIYRTEVEARAAQIRAGGGTYVATAR
jgi:hypothetical protein